MNLKNLKITALRSNDSKVHYTKEETGLCQQLVSALAENTELIKTKTKVAVTPQVMEVLEVLAPNATSATNLLRNAFNTITKQIIEHNKDESNEQIPGFPKQREYSSVTIMFRGAMKELGVDQKLIDEAFPSYQANKKTA